jgi:Tannase and feruloyl esterase
MDHRGSNIVDASRRWQRAARTHVRAVCIATVVTLATCGTATAQRIAPTTTCDTNGIGQATLVSDLPTFAFTNPPNDTSVTITSVSTGTTGNIPYCLVKLLVKPAINIWVGLPMGGNWNGRLQSEGGGGYAGSVGIPTGSISTGYIGVQTDTGHTGGSGTFGCINNCAGATQANPGSMDKQAQSDFAYRSEHLMAVLGKQLAQAFYGQQPNYSYWNGCSTGGRQGLRMAEQFPNDYNGLLVGAPAIHWDRFQAYQIWPQVVMSQDTGGPISSAKTTLATNAAVAACDVVNGVHEGFIQNTYACTYNPVNDPTITKSTCTASDNTCLTPAEAGAVQKIWQGATNTSGQLLWPGLQRGASLSGGLAGANPFSIAVAQPQYWVYFYPQWDWHTLNYDNYEAFFNRTMVKVNPIMASDNPNLFPFKATGGKILMWQGGADQLIMTRGSSMFYDAAATLMAGGDYSQIMPWFRHFIVPGNAHCGGGSAPQAQNLFPTMVNWVETGTAPDTLTAVQTLSGGVTRTRPVCAYPKVATYIGGGADPNQFASWTCQ